MSQGREHFTGGGIMGSEEKPLLQQFREFVTKGNILDLAVAVVIGIAFGAVVTALVDGVLMPLIAAIAGKPNFDALVLTVGDGRIAYGTFLTAVVNFLIVAAAMFVVVKTATRLQQRRAVNLDEAPAPSEETILLREIRDLLARTLVR